MNVIDVNLLLYAYDDSSELHEAAKAWLTREINGHAPTGLSLSVLLSFVRISTNVRILDSPMRVADACEIVDDWVRQPSVHLLAPTEQHWKIFTSLAIRSQAHGALAADADLAATAIEHGATLCTNDRDFARFEGLRISFPLAT